MPTGAALDRGRDAFARQAWGDAYTRLSALDRKSPLGPEDVERLATAAYLIGKDGVSSELLTRVHQDWLAAGEPARAARSAIWLAFRLMTGGQPAQGGGWIARARRIVDGLEHEVVERGYLRLADGYRRITAGAAAEACALFSEADAIAERFDDRDLLNLARQGRGRALIRLDRVDDGMALLDEVMIAVTAGDVSPIMVGNIYCSVIEGCHEVFDLRRAHEWTAALAAWCAAQPEIVPYRGQCLVRRAEILQLHGEWPGALDEAEKACRWLAGPHGHPAAGAAHYQRAELHRLRGDFAAAEATYAEASAAGRSPLPGLALLRLAQGRADAAWTAITRAIDETADRRGRARLLAAGVEIALDRRDVAAARAAADELSRIAASLDSTFLAAIAAQAGGAVLIEEGDPRGALPLLKAAADTWNEIDAPYDTARVRVLAGLASRALGDDDAWRMELEAARRAFERLGGLPDVERVDRLAGRRRPDGQNGLTVREVEVLRLVATGKTNRAIADALDISEKTVARHLSNIFTKLDLPSRAAATAYAYQHDLVSRSST
jgi:DNA-binding CsgD family transcriptional regulator